MIHQNVRQQNASLSSSLSRNLTVNSFILTSPLGVAVETRLVPLAQGVMLKVSPPSTNGMT